MKQKNDIKRELASMGSILVDAPQTMPYQVPQGYFNNLAPEIADQIQLSEGALTDLPKQLPFSVPEGYFQSLPQSILQKIQEEEPSVPAIPNPMKAPDGYFEQLPGQILMAVRQSERETAPEPAKQPTRTIAFNRVFRWKPLRYAAAACLVIAIGLGWYRYNLESTPQNYMRQLANISQEELQSYILYNIDDFETEDLLTAIDLPEEGGSSLDPVSRFSDEYIIQYLDETGWGSEL